MFYWFVLVSFNLNKSKTFGWGSEDIFLLARVIEFQFSASCLVAKQLLQMADGVAQLHVEGGVGIQR